MRCSPHCRFYRSNKCQSVLIREIGTEEHQSVCLGCLVTKTIVLVVQEYATLTSTCSNEKIPDATPPTGPRRYPGQVLDWIGAWWRLWASLGALGADFLQSPNIRILRGYEWSQGARIRFYPAIVVRLSLEKLTACASIRRRVLCRGGWI